MTQGHSTILWKRAEREDKSFEEISKEVYFERERRRYDTFWFFLHRLHLLIIAFYPQLAFFLLGIYGRNVLLLVGTVILGIGHIGIHYDHKREITLSEERTHSSSIST